MSMRTSCTVLPVSFLAALLISGSAYAQSVLIGTVRHDSTGAPLAGVEVLINGTPHRTETNTQGRYILGGLPAGLYQAIFRKVGHLPVRVDVRLHAGDTTRANTALIESAVVLDPVIVTGAPETTRGVGMGREAFEERRKMGFGKFLDSEYLRRVESHLHLDDVLRREAGVAVRKMGPDWVAVNRLRTNCAMQVYYNGAPVGRGGVFGVSRVSTVDLRMFALTGVESVEVFRSPAEIPQEYGGISAGCGVILIWSRVNP
ncbi:MAG: carboxypeptidase regulatory-like domain-containing protein [Gemmatimonadales bacterium]|nr:carboxypeptidase regulatory-like domain-containing protein [Gemmatimonadales bacterium]